MMIKKEIGEKDGKLCLLEIEMQTGKYHYYPIKARIEIQFTPNIPMFLPDPHLYVDREHEIV